MTAAPNGVRWTGIFRSWAAVFFLAVSAAIPAAARVSGSADGEVIRGPDDYEESTVGAGLSMSVGRRKDSRVGLRLFAERSVSGVRGSTETSVAWFYGGGVDAGPNLSLNLSLWRIPPPEVLKDGSYKARGMDAGIVVRWDGFLPVRGRSSWRGSVAPSISSARHEQYFVTPVPLLPRRPLLQWVPIVQRSAGLSFTETWKKRLWLGANARAYGYNRDLEDLSSTLEVLSRTSLGAANAYDLVLGFPANSWGARLGAAPAWWGELEVLWRRTTYVIGFAPRQDQGSATLSLSPFSFLTLRAVYQVTKPLGFKSRAYKGLGVELGF